jgi:hypothetical protein
MFHERPQAGDERRGRAHLASARSAAAAGACVDVERRATETLHRLG